jgi:hypothetical protein
MNGIYASISMETVVAHLKPLPQRSSGKTEKNYEEISLRKAINVAEIQISNLQNTTETRYLLARFLATTIKHADPVTARSKA